MKPLLLALALPVAALAWAGCGTSGNGLAPPPTFQCGEASLPSRPNCLYNTEYCLVRQQGSAVTPSCVAVPAACSGEGNPCGCISATYDGGTSSCTSFLTGTYRATTVSVGR